MIFFDPTSAEQNFYTFSRTSLKKELKRLIAQQEWITRLSFYQKRIHVTTQQLDGILGQSIYYTSDEEFAREIVTCGYGYFTTYCAVEKGEKVEFVYVFSKLADHKSPDDLAKTEDPVDFDKLLDDFIEKELSGDTEEEREEDFEKDDQENAEEGTIVIDHVLMDYFYDEGERADEPIEPTPRTLFRQEEGRNLYVKLELTGDSVKEDKISIEISDKNTKLLKPTAPVELSRENGKFKADAFFLDAALEEGVYEVACYYQGVKVKEVSLQIINLPEHYTECFKLVKFEILRMDEQDHSTIDYNKKLCQSSFKQESLEGIAFLFGGENILSRKYPYEFFCKIYDQVGSEVLSFQESGWVQACNVTEPSEAFIAFLSEQRQTLDKGNYKIEIAFLGEVVVSARFGIGNYDVPSIYTLNSIQPKTEIGGKKIVKKTGNALEKLQAMIGLDAVKAQIEYLASKVEFDKIRMAEGKKVKTIGLHSVFLGNPGTGKTTAVNYLGQILKDVGVLSKGHVVYEERNTLTGPYYGIEEEKTNAALERAKGGILFIDEAYTLYAPNDHKDPGRRIIETLLTALSDEENRDWMLIMAGYPEEMNAMMDSNPGLKSRFSNVFQFKDYSVVELTAIADLWLRENDYQLTKDARAALLMLIRSAHATKNKKFGNGRYIKELLEQQIQPAMANRVMKTKIFNTPHILTQIEKCDIPGAMNLAKGEKAIGKLRNLIGLEDLKSNIEKHLDFVRFVCQRRDQNIYTQIPPLHMIFTGNPGTGKTSVADYLGEIYHSLGLLSIGQVIKVSRADMIGAHIGETESKMQNILSRATGNVLFIDEAYTLFEGAENSKDYGQRAVEVLLDTLSKEQVDLIVIMAGYPKEMEMLLNSNPGLKGRFPYTFPFEDYTVDALLKIAEGVARKNDLRLSPEARESIQAVIKKEYRIKDANFSNARFATRLITTQIMPNMARRLVQMEGRKSKKMLQTVLPEDVPISAEEVKQINNNLFNEAVIQNALGRLDDLVGLKRVKQAIREFVAVSKILNQQGKQFTGGYPLKWSFTGNSGTGKSTVAEILSEILKAMHLLGKGHLVEVKAEELYALSTLQADEFLKKRMTESQQGLLFVDGDAPQFKNPNSKYDPDYLRMRLAVNTAEMPGTYAIVIAEFEAPRQQLAHRLSCSGVTDFDHTLVFEDYTPDELLDILKLHLKKMELQLEPAAAEIALAYICSLCGNRQNDYANARTMKLFARSIQKLSLLSGSCNGIVSATCLSKLAVTQPIVRKIGY